MQWYYLDANKQEVRFDENYVQALSHELERIRDLDD